MEAAVVARRGRRARHLPLPPALSLSPKLAWSCASLLQPCRKYPPRHVALVTGGWGEPCAGLCRRSHRGARTRLVDLLLRQGLTRHSQDYPRASLHRRGSLARHWGQGGFAIRHGWCRPRSEAVAIRAPIRFFGRRSSVPLCSLMFRSFFSNGHRMWNGTMTTLTSCAENFGRGIEVPTRI